MKRTLIHNAIIVNEGKSTQGSIVIEGENIVEILTHGKPPIHDVYDEIIDATGCYLLPGIIDDHVHFRDPGLTHKADIFTESCAAVSGGVTSVMDMPNTNPQTITIDAWENKQELFSKKCVVNYSCYFGATNDNYTVFKQLDRHRVCGIKLFMGSSTGNMLVDQQKSLEHIFSETDLLIAAHCENQNIINRNIAKYKAQYATSEDVPVNKHLYIRSAKACYSSSEMAIRLAKEMGARLHVLHVSTAKELSLFQDIPIENKKITSEVCISYLLFNQGDYSTLGTRIKCNPSIKRKSDQEALLQALNTNLIDVVATDHAPHLLNEKNGGALKAVSGMPMLQFSLVSMLELVDKGRLNIEKVVEKMCHAPAMLYKIQQREFIRTGYRADLVLVRPNEAWTVTPHIIRSKCGWSPLEGHKFQWKVEKTFVNGKLIYNDNQIDEQYRGEELKFN